ncbi:MAG TPA: thiamine phosphate synthase [Candidatus Omnitrophica bacterium]|nr:thiamine phosphate synthase [Candidatus Omnitrophota bacterium]
MDRRIYRIIDVNIDRAREGLRVIEDTMRFIFEKRELTERARELRQEISNLPSALNISLPKLLSSRESEADLGREREEQQRGDTLEIVSSNFSRVEESIRVIEEYSRILNVKATPQIKKIRFEVYTLQKKIHLTLHRKNRVSKLGLYIITDEEIAGKSHQRIAIEAVKGGADTIQLRDKKNSTRKILQEAHQMRRIIPEDKVLFIINDRADITVACDGDGVHLGKDDLPVQQVREIIGESKLIGVSCDNVEEAEKAEEAGADYISLGPIFYTTTKEGLPPPVGTEIITEAKKRISIPLVAIGGIDEDNMEDVLKAGADSIALISAALKRTDIAKSVKSLKENFLSITGKNS